MGNNLYNRQRLPTLFEVLNRRTQAPVDLWSFYVFMREQYRGVDYLDFWLDVVQHLSLCRHYVRSLRQSILASASERDNGSSRASSVLLDTLIQEGGLNDNDSQRLSAFLRGEDNLLNNNGGNNGNGTGRNSDTLYRLSALLDAMNAKEKDLADLHAPASRTDNFMSRINQNIQERDEDGDNIDEKQYRNNNPIIPGPSSGFQGPAENSRHNSSSTNNSYYSTKPSPSSRLPFDQRTSTSSNNLFSSSYPPQQQLLPEEQKAANRQSSASNPNKVSISADTIERLFPRRQGDLDDGSNWVTRQDIRQSSHRILVTYFIPGAEREIVLPSRIMRFVKHAIEVEGRDDPEVFDEAREYVFQAMEREAFPNFLAAKALGNLSPVGSLVRMVIGLFSLFAAFWVGFILIFLDWSPKSVRLWLIIPFAFGSYGIFASLYNLDPIMSIVGFSEAAATKMVRINEPYVRQLLVKRALYVLAVIVLAAVILVVIFALVPGKRL